MTLLRFFSFAYWKKHFHEKLIYFVTLTISCALLACLLLFLRSNRQLEFEGKLRANGNFDSLLYSCTVDYEPFLRKWDRIAELGGFYDLGYASVPDGTKQRTACWLSEESEDLFYLPCEEGRYPRESGEVAIDYVTALQMGIYPEIGKTVLLQQYDENEQWLGEQEYRICGIFHISDVLEFYGFARPSLRLPWPEPDYEYPVLFVWRDQKEVFAPRIASYFWQAKAGDSVPTDEELADYLAQCLSADSKEIMEDLFLHYTRVQGRAVAYNSISGQKWMLNISLDEFNEKLENGKTHVDMEEAWLLSGMVSMLFGLLVLLIYALTAGEIGRRRQQFAVYRKLGMSRRKLFAFVFLEQLLCLLLIFPLGLLLGRGMFSFVRSFYFWKTGSSLPAASEVAEIVKQVTFSPWLVPCGVILGAVLPAVFWALRRNISAYPEEAAEMERLEISKKRRASVGKNAVSEYCAGSRKRWSLTQLALLLLSAAFIGGAFFGYRYIKEKKVNSESSVTSRESVYNYTFQASNERLDADLSGVELGHQYGLTEEALETLSGQSIVRELYAFSVRSSSSLVLSTAAAGAVTAEGLAAYDMRRFFSEPEDSVEKQGEAAVYEAMGYDYGQLRFSLATLAVNRQLLEKIGEAANADGIDYDAVLAGDTAVVMITGELPFDISLLVREGEMLTVSDAVPRKEYLAAESLMELYETEEPVYQTETTDGGEYRTYAFGERVDYSVPVAAVIWLKDETLLSELRLSEGQAVLLTSLEGLAKAGIADRYDQVYANIDTDSRMTEWNSVWYRLIVEGGMKSLDNSLIEMRLQKVREENALTFGLLFAMFLITGWIGIRSILSLKHQVQKHDFALLRALGMTGGQLLRIELRQTLWLPFLGALLGVIPSLLYGLISSIAKYCEFKGEIAIVITDIESHLDKWYAWVPHYFELFGEGWWSDLLGIVLLTVVMLFAAVWWQRRSLSRGDISANLAEESV